MESRGTIGRQGARESYNMGRGEKGNRPLLAIGGYEGQPSSTPKVVRIQVLGHMAGDQLKWTVFS